MRYHTILFDLDGTLLDTLEDLTDAVNYVMRTYGYPEHSIEAVRGFVGNGIRVLMERATPDGEKNPVFEQGFALFQEYYLTHNKIKTRPYDGVRELLECLQEKGIRMAIVSNKNQPSVDALKREEFQGMIDVAVGDGEGRQRKPAPDGCMEAIRRLGLDPGDADTMKGILYVGDSEVDAATAKNAGLDLVLVTWGFRSRELLEQFDAAALIDRPQELLEIMGDEKGERTMVEVMTENMLGTFIFTVPWATMRFVIAEKETGDADVTMEVPEQKMSMKPEDTTVEGNVIRFSLPAMGQAMEYVLTFDGENYDVKTELPVLGPVSGKALSLAKMEQEQREMEEFLAEAAKKEVPKRSGEEIDALVEELLAKMTLEEKLGQMSQSGGMDTSLIGNAVEQTMSIDDQIRNGMIGSIISMAPLRKNYEQQRIAVEESRLGIPLLVCRDVIHGLETVFPIPLAWSCSFDPDGVERAAKVAAKEATSRGVMLAFAPMMDIARDPRWGRIAEGNGEDPYLDARMGEAVVRGYQGENLTDPDTMAACLKHFLGYGAAEGGRDYNTTEISDVTIKNIYMPPFQAALDAGAASVMSAFNSLNGTSITMSKKYLKQMLREELGFDGLVVSDYGAVEETMAHGCAEDGADAAAKCVDATLDMEMATGYFRGYLGEQIERGRISEAQIDAAVRRILKLKYQLGIMDNPYLYLKVEEQKKDFCQEYRQEARALARESAVLLKNDGLFPIGLEKKIALIGPKADDTDLCGTWHSSTKEGETVTYKAGFLAAGYQVEAVTTPHDGEALDEETLAAIKTAVEKSDVVLLALGETKEESGEAASVQSLDLCPVQMQAARAAKEYAASQGKQIGLLLVNGRPLLLNWFEEQMDGILETWFLGSNAGEAVADIVSGAYNPSGKLSVTFPRTLGQVPVYYNHLNTGRPNETGGPVSMRTGFYTGYLDGTMNPLYEFGYGLSYTTFETGEPVLSAGQFTPGDTLTVKVAVKNTGAVPGKETVQLYVRDVTASVSRPVKELKGFCQVQLAPGEETTVEFTLNDESFAFYNDLLEKVVEPGRMIIMAGTSSRDCDLKTAELVIR